MKFIIRKDGVRLSTQFLLFTLRIRVFVNRVISSVNRVISSVNTVLTFQGTHSTGYASFYNFLLSVRTRYFPIVKLVVI